MKKGQHDKNHINDLEIEDGHNTDVWWFPLFMSILSQIVFIIWICVTYDSHTKLFIMAFSIFIGYGTCKALREWVVEDSNLKTMKILSQKLSKEEYAKVVTALYY